MTETHDFSDDEKREIALRMAVQATPTGPANSIKELAETFFKFLKGE